MSENKAILSRAFLVYVPLVALALLIFAKLIIIQFVEGNDLRERAQKEVVREMNIPAERGNIYSSDGKLLATSVPVYNLHFDPVTVEEELFFSEISALSKKLALKIGSSSAAGWKNKLIKARNQKQRYVAIGKDLSYLELQEIKSFPIFNAGRYQGGLIIEQENYRKMPLGKIAERTIGRERKSYATGLEGAYSAYLKGKDGKRLKQKIGNQNWKPLNDQNEEEPENGLDLVCTINSRMQEIVHNALLASLEEYHADHGCAVLMDVKTGAIKAISNLGITKNGTYFEKRNYAVWESTEPGSTFKLAAVLALFEDGYADLNTPVDTENGIYEYKKSLIKDSNGRGYGKTSLKVAFEKSSNVGIAKTIIDHYAAQPQKFIDRLYSIGLHQSLDLAIKGEGKPRIPKTSDADWSAISLPWISFGYQVSFTPMQLLTFYNAVANDGIMVKPRFLAEIQNHGRSVEQLESEVINPAICSPETLDKLQALLTGVVQDGTAQSGKNSICALAGKTGTCQLNYWKEGTKDYQASFAGYFPAESPQYSCIVVINKPRGSYYGSTVAFPVFRNIAENIYRNSPQEIKTTSRNSLATLNPREQQVFGSEKIKAMPDLKGHNGHKVLSELENAGFKVRISGNGKVQWQYPSAGTKISTEQLIEIKLG
jgi:cell division protein FtsI (penicillin-binding protein 3)